MTPEEVSNKIYEIETLLSRVDPAGEPLVMVSQLAPVVEKLTELSKCVAEEFLAGAFGS